MLNFLVIRGLSAGKAYPVTKATGLTGRQNDCAVILSDLTISRHHFEYAFKNNRVSIKDLGSQNGTYIEKVLLKSNLRIDWKPGEVLHVGSTDLVWVPSMGQNAVPEIETAVLEDQTEAANIATMVADISKNELPVIGHSQSIQEAKLLASSFSRFNVPLLIDGEIGTGKAMMAQLIHRKGPASEGRFESVNCSSLRKDALEKALFGEDSLLANFRKEGSKGGTLFLEQVEDLAPELRERLARELPTWEDYIEGRFPKFRLISACNRPFASLTKKEDASSLDFFKQIKWLTFSLPPLRDRPNDVPQILDFCLRLYRQNRTLPSIHFSPEMIKLMQRHDWPGNVREFKYFVHQILSEAERKKFNLSSMRSIVEESEVLFLLLDSLQKQYHFESFSDQDPEGLSPGKRDMLKALRANHWRVVKAAQSLGVSRSQFFQKMKDTVRIQL